MGKLLVRPTYTEKWQSQHRTRNIFECEEHFLLFVLFWTNSYTIVSCLRLTWLVTYVKVCPLFGYIVSLLCAWAYTLINRVYKKIFGDQLDEQWVIAWLFCPVHLNWKKIHWHTYSLTCVKNHVSQENKALQCLHHYLQNKHFCFLFMHVSSSHVLVCFFFCRIRMEHAGN